MIVRTTSFALMAAFGAFTVAHDAVARSPAWLHITDGPRGEKNARISIVDIDFGTAGGAKQLRDRVNTAARILCLGPTPIDFVVPISGANIVECQKRTVVATASQVDAAILRASRGERTATFSFATSSRGGR